MPKSVYDFRFSVLFHCLLCDDLVPPALRDIFRTSVARYRLVVIKMPLNTN